MKILLINFFGSLFVVGQVPGPLSRRLDALKTWPSHQNRVSRQ